MGAFATLLSSANSDELVPRLMAYVRVRLLVAGLSPATTHDVVLTAVRRGLNGEFENDYEPNETLFENVCRICEEVIADRRYPIR